MLRIKKGLDLPISGAPKQTIDKAKDVNSVAIVGPDYIGMKPTMEVAEGDTVKVGQLLFTDKKNPAVRFTSPGCGRVSAINRGDKRAFQSVVIDLKGNEEETFASYSAGQFGTLERAQVVENLIRSGLWTSIRTRPFSKIPNPETPPHSIFVTAMDTQPLSPQAEVVIAEHADDFVNGVTLLSRLTDGKVHVCHGPNTKISVKQLKAAQTHEFSGPHPAGLVGTHIHFVDPVGKTKEVWHVGYQDVIAIGKLFSTGKLFLERVVSLAGPQAKNPRLVRTRIGAKLSELTNGETEGTNNRVVSGSVLDGRAASGAFDYLGRFHRQVSLLEEGNHREFLGWQKPGFNVFSITNLFASKMIPGKKFAFSTTNSGSYRAIVPIGTYEKVFPLDMVPTFLLKSLIVKDTDSAQQLGALELDEEDLALCTFVCPGKYDYGSILRANLTKIEKDG